jgi:uncharacterized protein
LTTTMPRSAPIKRACEIRIGAGTFLADASGALWHEGERTLIVADLHLEKGSAFARRGMMLPPYDTAATLAALAAVIAFYDPRRVVSLGDGFHDTDGAQRLDGEARSALGAMRAHRHWVWVRGNHDPDPIGLPGESAAVCVVGGVTARHEPAASATDAGEIAGHLHPVARFAGGRRRCFVSDRRRCVMPAFGAYAGGVELRDRAFMGLFNLDRLQAVILNGNRVHFFDSNAFTMG